VGRGEATPSAAPHPALDDRSRLRVVRLVDHHSDEAGDGEVAHCAKKVLAVDVCGHALLLEEVANHVRLDGV